MKRILIHRCFNTKIYIDMLYCYSAFLLTIIFAEYLLPYYYRNVSNALCLLMSVLGVVMAIVNVYLQGITRIVFCHIANVPLHSLTLYLFGAVPEYRDHNNGTAKEFFSAAIGCIFSIVVPLCCIIFLTLAKKYGWSLELSNILKYLFFIAVVQGLCNIFPVYPQDGGKMFKTILSLASKDEAWSHRAVCRVAAVFGLLVLYAGIMMVLNGMITGGICMLIFGTSSYRAVHYSMQRSLLSDQIRGIEIKKIMKKINCTVPQTTPLNLFLPEFVYKFNDDVYPVTGEYGTVEKFISGRQAIEYTHGGYETATVGEIKPHEGSMFLIDKNCDLLNAFSVMQQTGVKRLIVIDSLLSRHVLGTVTSDDVIAAFLKVMHGVQI